MKEGARKMSQMSQEELDELVQQSGELAGFQLTPEMARQAADSIAQMDGEEMKNIPTGFCPQSR